MNWSLEGGPTRGLLVTRGSLDCNRCPYIFERDPSKWGFPRSSLGGCKPPKAVDLTYVSALGLGPILDAYWMLLR